MCSATCSKMRLPHHTCKECKHAR
ncbi:MAG: hypothetical protein JXQ79_10190 [Rhodobacteraceae bacterium]|nr:hypothetical protein [Paracoccaceae bacterium]